MQLFDPSQVANGLVTAFIGATASWIVVHLMKFGRDINASFTKLRQLEDKIKVLEAEVFDDNDDQRGVR